MCGTCGCGEDNHITYSIPGQNSHHHGNGSHNHDHTNDIGKGNAKEIQLEIDILAENNMKAERNRGYFEALNIFALNLVSSPGSGKTSLLEKTIKELRDNMDLFIIEGDQQTSNDADRISAAGAPVVQVNTGNGCHLDAEMVNVAAKQLKPKDNSVLFIENVGNLVCPSMFDLGETSRIVIISTTEGEDKPLKYPTMFQTAQLCIINKTDLLPYVDFDIDKAKEYASRVNNNLEFISLSVKTGDGMDSWYKWLKEKCK
ncbi:MAG: hydrogenase nickel incorporation protein HypB [Lentimicrobiaceae bacterium]|jgi:hydrogenase nickel incorporation protein HypB|nr:hydrogenase nickel incorporation protein HypB [Lentimicrobiaceae bacterium]MCP4909897.1 hydrogenase nickel incorporation protein HypB [Bacteroidota bacterium]MBT3453698.1 hydrogenase nickel incorporation protein HypB [Lentimicrobiaceae bacterium]MBT3818217.1 hydrogenase nickel incorporation protein HypB [Lentimicrobiaceae bacterium]MBT4061763.1 hydrogenase nickel incorporation protein HypB [Lentimicrobiaceae bacterium]